MNATAAVIKKPVIVIVGPTAIGKTELSLLLAELYNCEIVSLDSMQIYRYMNIGTAKATKQEMAKVKHHLIDIVNPDEPYDVFRYVNDALQVIDDIHKREKTPLVTGGTGLYLRALTEGLFEGVGEFKEIRDQLHQRLELEGNSILHEELALFDCISAIKIHKNDTHRLIRALEIYHGTGIPWSQHIENQRNLEKRPYFKNLLQIGLNIDRQTLFSRINKRTTLMLRQGLKEEVEQLLNNGYSRDLKSMGSIGYRHMVCHLMDNWSREKTENLLARDTRHYAKRQLTWFKKSDLHWFEPNDHKAITQMIFSHMNL